MGELGLRGLCLSGSTVNFLIYIWLTFFVPAGSVTFLADPCSLIFFVKMKATWLNSS